MNKALFLFFLLLSFSLASAAIINYNVPTAIKLGEVLRIDGQISPAISGVQCSFRIYEEDGNFIRRLTDEYTTESGVFSSSYFVISEPAFFRTDDYNVFTDCNGSVEDAIFTVEQKRDWGNFFFGEMFYLFENSELLVLTLIIVAFLVIAIALVYVYIKGAFR